MPFRELQLDRDKIADTIKEHFDVESLVLDETQKNALLYKITVRGQATAELCVYPRPEGRTTLSIGTSGNQELAQRIAKTIKAHCEYAEIPSGNLYIRSFNPDNFEFLKEDLKKNFIDVDYAKKLQAGHQYKLIGPQGESLYINLFNNGSLQVQGASRKLKQVVIDSLAEILSFKEILDIQLQSIDVRISADDAIQEMKEMMPESYDYLGERLISIISPSITFKHINLPLKDFSSFVFPILRGLEGYMKKLFLEKGITITSRDAFGEHFERSPRILLIESTKRVINCNETSNAIEDCYKHFKSNRHGIFHVDSDIETTRILTKEEAIELINDTAELIESSFSRIPKPSNN